jgi:hypothetical protein
MDKETCAKHKWRQGGGKRGPDTLGDIYCGLCGFVLTPQRIRSVVKKLGFRTSSFVGGGMVREEVVVIKRDSSGDYFNIWCEDIKNQKAALTQIADELAKFGIECSLTTYADDPILQCPKQPK